MLNSIILMGRLTKDPELRKTASGMSVVNFTLAFDNPRKEADGSRGTSFIPVVCFDNVADNVATHLNKGKKVAAIGSIQQRSYLKEDGSKVSIIEVVANTIEFVDPKPSEPNLNEIPVEELGNEVSIEEEKEEPKEQLFDPYTGKPLKPSQKK